MDTSSVALHSLNSIITYYDHKSIVLAAEWKVSGKRDDDTEERNRFVIACEEVISVENSAWMAEWAEDARVEPRHQ